MLEDATGKTVDLVDFDEKPQFFDRLSDLGELHKIGEGRKNKETDCLSYDLRLLLTEYMGFWHFYHHTYGYTIKWEKFLHLFLCLTDFGRL